MAVDATETVAPAVEATVAEQRFGQEWPESRFDAAVIPDRWNADGIAALEARMGQFVEDGDVAGIATLLVQDGQVISHFQSGISKIEMGQPISEDTIYRIYSMTKPVTAVALMMLYEDGRFELDDPISKHLPEFADLKVLGPVGEDGSYPIVALERQPTVAELLSHTAGFAYGLFGDDPANAAFREQQIIASPDLDTFIDRVSDVPLLYQPGVEWYYSAAVDIQGAMVERLSGQTFGEFLDENIFSPLDMADTGFFVPENDLDRFSDVFGYDPESGAFGPVQSPRVAYRKDTIRMESGGGGLVSTIGDYARFSQMLADGGTLDGVEILRPETVDLMRTDILPAGASLNIAGTLDETVSDSLGFGLGFGIYLGDAGGELSYGEGTYFWGGAAGTWFWIDPVHDLHFIGMIQRFPTGGPDVDFRGISGEFVYAAMTETGAP